MLADPLAKGFRPVVFKGYIKNMGVICLVSGIILWLFNILYVYLIVNLLLRHDKIFWLVVIMIMYLLALYGTLVDDWCMWIYFYLIRYVDICFMSDCDYSCLAGACWFSCLKRKLVSYLIKQSNYCYLVGVLQVIFSCLIEHANFCSCSVLVISHIMGKSPEGRH